MIIDYLGMDPSPVRRLREEAGLRLSELARRIDYSVGHLSDVEKGRHPGSDIFRARVARELSKELGRTVTPSELVSPPHHAQPQYQDAERQPA